MGHLLFDTSIYISALRFGDVQFEQLRPLAAGSCVWLSAVVVQELYAGASRRDSHVVDRLEHDFDRVGRVLTPNSNDWASAGKVLARLAAKYDYEHIRRSRLSNDALLATSAARRGITIITANARDFARLAQFRPLHWQLIALP
jgi:predicted nucleic acid-binding protein